MPVFIIHDGSTVINRVLADTVDDISLEVGQEVKEAVSPWDGEIGQSVDVNGVVEPVADLGKYSEDAINSLYGAYIAKLHGGYASIALGTAHVYSTTEEARNDLFGAASLGLDRKFYCLDTTTGGKVNPLHTAAQLAQIAGEFADAKEALIEAFYANRALIEDAADLAGVDLALSNGRADLDAVATV